MKLIIACEIYPPDVGGPATFVKALVPVLTKAGHSVKVLTYADKKSIEESLVKVSRKGPIFLRYCSLTTKGLFNPGDETDN